MLYKSGVACLWVFLLPQVLSADDESHGLIFYERLLASSNTFGNVFRLDTTAGYSFNRHVSIDGGLPVFFVRPSGTATALAGTTSATGIGNAYLELRFAAPNSLINYSTVLTGTAPTGDKDSGLSTGRATADWTNHFDRSFGPLTPFANIGFANTISDTPLFVRPYTTLGFVTHLEGGGAYRVARFLEAGAAAYAIEPAGQQTVVSELVPKTAPARARAANNDGRGGRQGAFESAHITVGSADLARDNGFSFWGAVHPTRTLSLQLAFTRSAHYAFNTISFGIGVNLGSVLRNMRSYD
ncbi:MAG TPA: hypothetical protein VFA54_06510 [Bryobacterales bacterium]|jgi:hypothetical protein|nr:hypothetical protein [Bryobacterales bacterium]